MIIESQFKPAWWLLNAHAQTIWPKLTQKKNNIELFPERLELTDRDFLDLTWTREPHSINSERPIVILLHGLEGSIHSHYAKSLLTTISANGWTGVLMHFRGCSGEHNRLARSYHSGETGDIHYLINTLKNRHPGLRLGAIGISLGGNVLLKYLGEQGNNSLLSCAMAVSVPFDLADGAAALNKGFSKIYQRHLIKSLQDKILDKFRDKPAPVAMDRLHEWTDFYSFDHHVTAPIHGFNSADDYYSRCSSKPFIKSIKTPVLILHSKDDPFMSQAAIPDENELSPSVTLELANQGGHVGFLYGNNPLNAKSWIEKRLGDFFREHLS